MTPDLQPEGVMPNLYTPAGQESVVSAAGDARVIIVDNLSCLVRGGKENDGESWQPVAEAADAVERTQRCVHPSRRKRRATAWNIQARGPKRPVDYVPDQGARFEVHFEKARALYGQDVTPFEAALQTAAAGEQVWMVRPVSEVSEAKMIELAGLGLSTREIGSELGVSHSTVARELKKAQHEGRYAPKPKSTAARSPARTPANHDVDAYRRASGGA